MPSTNFINFLEIEKRTTETIVGQQAEMIDLEKELFGAALDDIIRNSRTSDEKSEPSRFGGSN
jgi:hypothetical protein